MNPKTGDAQAEIINKMLKYNISWGDIIQSFLNNRSDDDKDSALTWTLAFI